MKFTDVLSIALYAATVSGQAAFCNGARRPDWNDCQLVIDDFGLVLGDAGTGVVHTNGELDPAPSCMHWWWIGGNCRITHCFQDTTAPGDSPRTRTGGEIFTLYDPIRSRCSTLRAGGEFTGALEFVNVFNDEDQSTTPPAKRSVQHANGLVTSYSSLEDYEQWLNDTAPSVQTDRADSMVRSLLEARQTEGDTGVNRDFTALAIRNPNAFELGPRLSKGVKYTYEVSESTTFGVTTSVNVGGAWSVFTASIGIEMKYEETFTVTEGLEFDVNCENQGQITFYPFYDYYELTFTPSGTKAEVWVPVYTSERKVSGEIAIACQG